MNYSQNEKVKILKNFLSNNEKRKAQIHIDEKAIEADYFWDASRFWAETIHKADAFIILLITTLDQPDIIQK